MCRVCDSFGGIGCPVCEDERTTVECPECDGLGLLHFDEDGERITVEEYYILGESKCIVDYCETCNAKGYRYE
jgi:hypothetical protein